MQVGTGRIVISFLAFIPLFLYYLKDIDWDKLWPLLVVGLCGSGLPAILYATAQTHIDSGIAGLLNAMTPIFTFILALWIFGRRFAWKQLVGIILGFMGTLIIFMGKGGGAEQFPLYYGLLIVIATFCYGVSANTVSHSLKSMNPLIISTVSFMLIGPWALIYLLQSDFVYQISNHEYGSKSLAALMILSLVGTFGANILFFKLIQMTDPVFSASVSFLTPIVAFMWAVWDGEEFSLFFFFALALILAGVFLVKFKGGVRRAAD